MNTKSDLIKINSRTAHRWVRGFMHHPIININYDNHDKIVIVDAPLINETITIFFPILNSVSANTKFALEPLRMIDAYSLEGQNCIYAPGHNPISIEGLKTCLKILGIEAKVKKIKKSNKNGFRTIYTRYNYKIILENDADYAYFKLYFFNDICNFIGE